MLADLRIILEDLIVFKPLCERIRRETGGFCQLSVTGFPEMTPDIGFGDAARPLEFRLSRRPVQFRRTGAKQLNDFFTSSPSCRYPARTATHGL
jgi:hypothetical protein